MAITYAQLLQLVQDELANTETSFVSNIPTFVRQAEQEIYRSVYIPALRKNSTASTTASDEYLSKPTDYIATSSFYVVNGSGDTVFLLPKDVNFIRAAYPSATTEGVPRFYASFSDDTFILGPTPDASYTVQLHYFYDPESIVTASTTWLGNNAQNALIFGTLIKAYTYMKGNPEKMAMYESQYRSALQNLGRIGDFREKRDSYRNNEPRIEV